MHLQRRAYLFFLSFLFLHAQPISYFSGLPVPVGKPGAVLRYRMVWIGNPQLQAEWIQRQI